MRLSIGVEFDGAYRSVGAIATKPGIARFFPTTKNGSKVLRAGPSLCRICRDVCRHCIGATFQTRAHLRANCVVQCGVERGNQMDAENRALRSERSSSYARKTLRQAFEPSVARLVPGVAVSLT